METTQVPREHPVVERPGLFVTPLWERFWARVASIVAVNDQRRVLVIEHQMMTWGAAAPTTGVWAAGDLVWRTPATVGQPNGWRCTVSGEPGTWVAMANL